jgi:surface protein
LYAAFKASGIEYLPVWDTSKVTNMEQCFDGCANLKRLPNWNTSKVTNMSWMCSYCGKLVDVPIWDLSSATNIYKMFAEDGALSDESLNNILYMLAHAKTKSTLKNVGINSSQAARCQTLSNYQAFLDAGWTTGY